MDTSLIVLGSAQDGGSPQFGSPARMPSRTAASVAVRIGEDWILMDASPDLRIQWERAIEAELLPPVLPRVVAITHAHMGHYAGLVHFGTEAADARAVDLVAPRSVIRHLAANEPWGTILREHRLVPRPTESGAHRIGHLDIVGVPVPHRGEYAGTVGFSIRRNGIPWALYLPDIDSWEEWPEATEVIGEHDIALVDATFGSPDELPHRTMASVPHPTVSDTIERFGHLTARTRIVLTHLNHTNSLGAAPTPLRDRAEAAGFLVAEDGMVFDR